MQLLNISESTFLDLKALGRQWTWLAAGHNITLATIRDLVNSTWSTKLIIDERVIYAHDGKHEPPEEWEHMAYVLLDYDILCEPVTTEVESSLPMPSLAP